MLSKVPEDMNGPGTSISSSPLTAHLVPRHCVYQTNYIEKASHSICLVYFLH